MEIRWLTAFIDLPDETFDRGTAFWQAVTGSAVSAPRGDASQFATLIPADGDSYLRVQRTSRGPRIHLDLHVDSVAEACRTAEDLGAVVETTAAHAVMSSPAGSIFCFVPHHGESVRPGPIQHELEHRVDQVCIDVPTPLFEAELRFWHLLTGWEQHRSKLEEFASLQRPPSLPLRVMFQRLGADDLSHAPRAHLDLACGSHVEEVRRQHERLGAEFVSRGPVWTTMRDPAQMLYCLTQRNPHTGLLDT